ncbi:MAG: hypothetical protein ABIN89_18730 [Chitinophagaceae bacterium]
MNKLNLSIVVFAIIFLGFGSCIKKMDQSTPTSPTAVKFSEINASESFNWSTTNKVNFSFKGTAVDEYQLVLRVTDADGAILIQKLQKSNEDYKVILEVPAYYDTLTVTYGSISEPINCRQGSVNITID